MTAPPPPPLSGSEVVEEGECSCRAGHALTALASADSHPTVGTHNNLLYIILILIVSHSYTSLYGTVQWLGGQFRGQGVCSPAFLNTPHGELK